MTNARRTQQIRARATIRRWEFRQRDLAHGAWHRFRLALAAARTAFAIEAGVLDQLVAAGARIDDRGMGLSPPKRIVWLTEAQADRLVGAIPLEMHLDAAMLEAQTLALVPFGPMS